MAPARDYGATMVANPYPTPKTISGINTICEICDDRVIKTKDWNSHKNSKAHRKNEEALRLKGNAANSGASGSWGDAPSFGGETASWGDASFSNNGGNNFKKGGDAQGGRQFSGTCYGCGEEGHSKRDCPKSGGNDRACYNCGLPGHNKADCTNPRQGGGGGGSGDRTCYGCGLPGHNKADCPSGGQGPGGGGGRGGGFPCFNCGEIGHRKADCPNEKVIKCNNCDEEGHVSRDCTKRKDWSRVTCNNCGLKGHTQKRCTEPPKEEANTGGDGGWGNETSAAPASGGWADETNAAPAAGGWGDEANAAPDSGGWPDEGDAAPAW